MSQSAWVEQVRVYVRGNSGFYAFDEKLYAAILIAWKGGQTFFTGESINGDEITVKLAEVEAIMDCSPASLEAACRRAKAESKAMDSEAFE